MKQRYVINIAVFVGFISIFAAVFFITPDAEISKSERRRLTQYESYSERKRTGGEVYGLSDYFRYLDKYSLDQFPARDSFRTVKAVFGLHVLAQRDNNGYYLAEDTMSHLEPTINERAVTSSVEHINRVYNRYFEQSAANAYYAIVPDKNYYIAERNDYLHYDYNRLFEFVREQINIGISEISIADHLTAADYYRTDPHWAQPRLMPLADHILSTMGTQTVSQLEWTEQNVGDFYGTYYGHMALPTEPDRMTYLTSRALEGVTIYDHAAQQTMQIYNDSAIGGIDPYDLFLGGAKPLLTITNPNAENNRQLWVFRDSFGSSLVPLLIPAYSEIVVADTRYISAAQLGELEDIRSGCDVLFMYSTTIVNTYGAFVD